MIMLVLTTCICELSEWKEHFYNKLSIIGMLFVVKDEKHANMTLKSQQKFCSQQKNHMWK